MISETLSVLNDEGILTAKQIADLLNLSHSSAYRYLSGETQPTFGQVRTLFRQSRHHEVQRRILETVIESTGWVCQHLDADKDINGDGCVDTCDLLDGALKVNDRLARLLTQTRNEQKRGMKSICTQRAAELHASINESIQTLLAVQQAVTFLQERQTRKSA